MGPENVEKKDTEDNTVSDNNENKVDSSKTAEAAAESEPTTDKSKIIKKNQKKGKCKGEKNCLARCVMKCCPYFPVCCDLPLQNCLQIIAVLDLFIATINVLIWLCLHQYDPFSVNVLQYQRNNETTTGASISTTESPDVLDFHESTTALYGKDATGHFIDASIDAQSYSKIAYVSAVVNGYEQEVNNMCGRDYLSKFLVGHNLDITNRVFTDIVIMSYVSEMIYQFNDVSLLATTCCFFEYTSGRLYLIIVWNLELFPFLLKLYTMIENRSQRLCIFQYGLSKNFRGLDAVLYLHILPLVLFRAFRFLAFTCYIGSMLELGNLEHQTRIQGDSLHAYVERQEEYSRMDKNWNRSSSEDDDVINV